MNALWHSDCAALLCRKLVERIVSGQHSRAFAYRFPLSFAHTPLGIHVPILFYQCFRGILVEHAKPTLRLFVDGKYATPRLLFVLVKTNTQIGIATRIREFGHMLLLKVYIKKKARQTQMWKAALVASKPTAAKIDQTFDESLRKRINTILYDASDRSSCFYDEISVMKHEPPNIDRMLSNGAVYIVGSRGIVMGVVGVDESDDIPYLYGLCVCPRCRGRGIGELMIKTVIHDNDCINLCVWKSGAHDRLVDFYTRMGFKKRLMSEGHYTHMHYATNHSPVTGIKNDMAIAARSPRVRMG